MIEKSRSMYTINTVDGDLYLKKALATEIEVMKRVKSDNTVALIDILESNTYYYIV